MHLLFDLKARKEQEKLDHWLVYAECRAFSLTTYRLMISYLPMKLIMHAIVNF